MLSERVFIGENCKFFSRKIIFRALLRMCLASFHSSQTVQPALRDTVGRRNEWNFFCSRSYNQASFRHAGFIVQVKVGEHLSIVDEPCIVVTSRLQKLLSYAVNSVDGTTLVPMNVSGEKALSFCVVWNKQNDLVLFVKGTKSVPSPCAHSEVSIRVFLAL